MKKFIRVSAALLATFVIATIASACDSTSRAFLRQSEDDIRAYLLELTPIGMDMDEARRVIEQRFQIDEWGRQMVRHQR